MHRLLAILLVTGLVLEPAVGDASASVPATEALAQAQSALPMGRPVGAWPCAVGSWVSTKVKNFGTALRVTGGGAGAHMTIKSSGPFKATFTGMSKLYYEDSGVTGYFRYGGFLSGTLLRGQRVQLAGAHGYEFFLKGIDYVHMTVTIDIAESVETRPEGSGLSGAGGGSAPWSHGYFECYGSSLVLYDMNVPSGSSDWTFARS